MLSAEVGGAYRRASGVADGTLGPDVTASGHAIGQQLDVISSSDISLREDVFSAPRLRDLGMLPIAPRDTLERWQHLYGGGDACGPMSSSS